MLEARKIHVWKKTQSKSDLKLKLKKKTTHICWYIKLNFRNEIKNTAEPTITFQDHFFKLEKTAETFIQVFFSSKNCSLGKKVV